MTNSELKNPKKGAPIYENMRNKKIEFLTFLFMLNPGRYINLNGPRIDFLEMNESNVKKVRKFKQRQISKLECELLFIEKNPIAQKLRWMKNNLKINTLIFFSLF